MGLFDNVNKATEQAKADAQQPSHLRVATKQSNLNIRKGPGTDYEIIGKAAHGSTVQLIRKENNDWFYIRTADGVEGYSSADFLQAL